MAFCLYEIKLIFLSPEAITQLWNKLWDKISHFYTFFSSIVLKFLRASITLKDNALSVELFLVPLVMSKSERCGSIRSTTE